MVVQTCKPSRETVALMQILSLGDQQMAEGRTTNAAEVIGTIREGKRKNKWTVISPE